MRCYCVVCIDRVACTYWIASHLALIAMFALMGRIALVALIDVIAHVARIASTACSQLLRFFFGL